jgi:phosphoribosylanthranilate isomerase
MPRTRIKICGICRSVDAEAAVAAGADAIGLNFHPESPRYISFAQARQIVEGISPFVSIVGLFVDADARHIKEAMEQVPLSVVQLHGDESPQLVAELRPIRVIKVLRADKIDGLSAWHREIRDLKLTNLIGVLLDTPAALTGVPGGSGIANNWAWLSDLQRSGKLGRDGLGPLIIAGGLTPENVGEAIQLLRPFAVDVSSGVESSKREKSPEKIAAFVSAVRQADARLNP